MITGLRTPIAVFALVGLLSAGAGILTAGTSGVPDPPVLLPDGTEFQTWEDVTDYRRVYYVDQRHPVAADDNPGTEEAPFLTIQRAADVVRPAEKVLIKSGLYREWVRPRLGGTGPDGMVSFEAAPGAEAVISGSEVLRAVWTNSGRSKSANVWKADLPPEFFGDNHPFAAVNTSDADFAVMRWARAERGRIPHTLPRAMVFQDGRRLTQLARIEELHRVAGTFWIDGENRQLHLNPFDRRDPNTRQIEVTTRQFLINPLVKGMEYIRIKGLTFEHAGNGFIRSGNGAITTWGGRHWIIEENTVRHVNAVGIEIGAFTEEGPNAGNRNELAKTTGDHLVRRNHVYDCGTGGIQGTVVSRSLVSDNHVHDCGWQDVERYWEVAGIKLLIMLDSVVTRNHVHDCYASSGIWIDFANRNTRVTRNLIHDISSYAGGLFFEASNVINLIDHNVVYNVQGSGFYLHDSDRLLVTHNLLVNCAPYGIRMTKTKTRDRVGVSKHNRVINNVVAECPVPFEYANTENVSDYNIVSGAGQNFSLAEWQSTGLDSHSRTANLDIAIGPEDGILSWSARKDEVLKVTRDERMGFDYFGRKYPGGVITVGPFIEGWSPAHRRLKLVLIK